MNIFDIAHKRRKIITKSIYKCRKYQIPNEILSQIMGNKSLYINLQNTEEAACPGIESAV